LQEIWRDKHPDGYCVSYTKNNKDVVAPNYIKFEDLCPSDALWRIVNVWMTLYFIFESVLLYRCSLGYEYF
jgi:hypothetical protein